MPVATSEFPALFDCDNPVAFITGSVADRVGRRVAEFFQARGFRVVLHSRGSPDDSTRTELGGKSVLRLTGAIEDESTVESWCEQIVAAEGRCDVLVQSAAIWNPKPLEDTTRDDFAAYMNVNAIGPALGGKHFGLQMASQPSGGAIINIGDWAVRRPYRDFCAYLASKGAVKTITESLAVELASRNPRVRVNSILPGPVKIDERVSAERREQIRRECLLQREGTAEDVANAAFFLATSPFITGVSLPVDGGRSIFAGQSTDPIAHPDV